MLPSKFSYFGILVCEFGVFMKRNIFLFFIGFLVNSTAGLQMSFLNFLHKLKKNCAYEIRKILRCVELLVDVYSARLQGTYTPREKSLTTTLVFFLLILTLSCSYFLPETRLVCRERSLVAAARRCLAFYLSSSFDFSLWKKLRWKKLS